MPYNFGKLAENKKGPIITNNYKRVIEVWFDDKHKEYFYTREPMARSVANKLRLLIILLWVISKVMFENETTLIIVWLAA